MSIHNWRAAARTVLAAVLVVATLSIVGSAYAAGAGVPRAVDDSLTVAPGGTGTVAVLANDTSVDAIASVSLAGNTPDHGSASFGGDHVLTYTAQDGYHGGDWVSYVVTDIDGDAALGNVRIVVVAGSPVSVRDHAASTQLNAAVAIFVVDNDSVPDGFGSLTIAGAGAGPDYGNVAVTGDKITYTPDEYFQGADYFTFLLFDLNGDSASGSVEVRVHDGLDVDAQPDEDRVQVAGTRDIDVLANDASGDLPVVLVTYASTSDVAGAALSVVDQKIRYRMPAPGFRGWDYFAYTITDANGDTESSYVSVLVHDEATAAAAPDAPTMPTPPPAPAVGRVAPTLTVRLSASAVPLRTPARITGTVTPSSGVTVTLRRKSATSWTTVTSMSPTSTGAYSFGLRTGRSGAGTYRVSASGAGITTAMSAEKILTVFGARIRSVGPGRAESVLLHNTGKVPVALGGMTLRDKSGKTLVLPRFTLKVGRSVTVFTGKGRSTATKLFVGKKKPVDVWSTHDVARLMTAGGTLVVRLKY